MTWFKVDDGFWSHPKVIALSSGAIALWVKAGSYSCQHLTDGFIASNLIPLFSEEKFAAELVEYGLWSEAKKGYKFHDWAAYQETSETVKRRRDQWKQRQNRARGVTGDVTRDTQRDTQRDSRMESRSESLSPVPSRPVPSSSSKEEESATPKRRHPLPKDWAPKERHHKYATENHIDLNFEAEKFKDRNLAKGEKYLDWDRAFSNWLRTDYVKKLPTQDDIPSYWR